MGTLFSENYELVHAAFDVSPFGRQPGQPLGIAYAARSNTVASALTDETNSGTVTFGGISGYTYTLQHLSTFITASYSAASVSSANEALLVALLASFSGRYFHWPIYNDISNQELWNGDLIASRQQWALESATGLQTYEDDTGTRRLRGQDTHWNLARTRENSADWPTALRLATDSRAPRVDFRSGPVDTAFLVANGGNLTFQIEVAYLYWAPQDRLSARASYQVPIRGT